MKKILELLERDAAGNYEMIRALKLVAVDRQKYELGAAIRDYEVKHFPEALKMRKDKEEAMDKAKPKTIEMEYREWEKENDRILKAIQVEVHESKDFKNGRIIKVKMHGPINTVAEAMGILEIGKLDLYKAIHK